MADKQPLQVFYTKHQAGLTMIINGVPAVVDRTNPNYSLIEADLKAGKYDRIIKLANLKNAVNDAIAEAGEAAKLSIRNGRIYWAGPNGQEEVKGPLVDRIVTTIRNGSTVQAVKPLIKLLGNISRNKAKDLREELYQFLMSGAMPITQDGCFLAYKRVRSDFKDCHSGTMDNRPGKLVWQDPATVDTNRHNTCSRGLHFCSRGYLSHFHSGQGKTVIVKVNPRHVYAIPTDYECQKGRASEYYVVGVCTGDPQKDELFLQPFIYDDNVKAAAPQVKFVGEKKAKKGKEQETVTINNLKPSLKTMAEGYGLSSNNKAWVRVEDSKGAFTTERYTVVRKNGSEFISTMTGKPVPAQHVRELSIETKSVRSALVRAVARCRSRG